MKVTAETITDEQILELRGPAARDFDHEDLELWAVCVSALNPLSARRAEARRRCAAAWNARHGADK